MVSSVTRMAGKPREKKDEDFIMTDKQIHPQKKTNKQKRPTFVMEKKYCAEIHFPQGQTY